MRYLVVALAGLCACLTILFAQQMTPVVEWEHGFKTDYVVATRYRNPTMGYNIGFKFPKQPYDSDRAETLEFIEQNGGAVYQGGGYPGAEVFATFNGVTDKETANVFLKDFIPKLDKHMRGLWR